MARRSNSASSATRRSRSAGDVATGNERTSADEASTGVQRVSAEDVLDALEERLVAGVAVSRVPLVGRQRARELLEQVFLFLRELLRYRHARDHVQVAPAAAVHVG